MAIEDFDDILPHVGSFGRFQKRIFVFSLPINVFLAVVYFSQIYQTLTPEHWCAVPELSHLDPEVRRNLSIPLEVREGQLVYSRCSMFDINFTEITPDEGPNASWPIKPCSSGWEYDYSGGLYPTITSEADWVCDDDWRPNFAQSMFFVGAILGSFLFSFLADWYGRLPVLIVSNVLASAAGVATGFTTGFVDYVACRFIVGIAYDFHYTMMYIILMEYVGPEKRTMVANVPLALFLTLGVVTLPWIAYGLGDWRMFAIITSAPLTLIVSAYWIVPESGRWLIHKGKVDRAIGILKQCADVNGKVVDQAVYDEFKEASQRMNAREKELKTSWLDLFRTPKMRTRMLVNIFTWMVLTVVYDGYVRSLDILAYNVFVTNSVAGFLELPADLVPLLTMDQLGRRWTLSLSLLFAGLAGIATGLVPTDQTMVIAVLAMVGRFFITITINAGSQYNVEIVPTQLRGQGVGLVHISGHCATFFAPLILYMSTIHSTLPYLVLGGISLLGGGVCLSLPETAMKHLPESVAEAEAFGQDQGCFYVPCIANRREQERQVESSK